MILSLLCFSPHNLNQHYITWHQICLHLFKNHKLVPGCFLIFFFTACLFVYSNSEYQMTLIILLIKYLRIFYTLSYWLMFKIYFPTKCGRVKHKYANNTWLIFHHLPFSHFLSFFFFSSKIYAVYTYSCTVTSGDVNAFSQF